MAESNRRLAGQAGKLYQRYGKPLEEEHWGEYVGIFPDGRWVLAPSRLEALERALEEFGPGSFLFRVGDKVVGRWR